MTRSAAAAPFSLAPRRAGPAASASPRHGRSALSAWFSTAHWREAAGPKTIPSCRSPTQYDAWLKRLAAQWGGPSEIETFAPSLADNRQARSWWAGLLRAASSPGAIKVVLDALRDTDVRAILPSIRVPTLVVHRRGDRAVRVEAGRHLAGAIPMARLIELEGDDHWAWAGDQDALVDQIRTFAAQL